MPVTSEGKEVKLGTAQAGKIVKIPHKLTWGKEFNGNSVKFKAYGTCCGDMKERDVPNKAATAEEVLDLAALKTPPGDYTLAFKGIGITKYHPNQDEVKMAEEQLKKAAQEVTTLTTTAKNLAGKVTTAPAAEKAEAANAAKIASGKQKLAEVAMADATKLLKTLTAAAAPKDIIDILVSEPIRISVKAAQVASAAATPKK